MQIKRLFTYEDWTPKIWWSLVILTPFLVMIAHFEYKDYEEECKTDYINQTKIKQENCRNSFPDIDYTIYK